MKENNDFTPIPICLTAVPTGTDGEVNTTMKGRSDYEYRSDHTAVEAEFQIYNPSAGPTEADFMISLLDGEGREIARKPTRVQTADGEIYSQAKVRLPFGEHGPVRDGVYSIRIAESCNASETLLEKRIRLADLHGLRAEEVYTAEEAFVTDGHESAPRHVYAEAGHPYEYLHVILSSPLKGIAPLPELWAVLSIDGNEIAVSMNTERPENTEDICPDPDKISASILLPDPYTLECREGHYRISIICLGHAIGRLTCETCGHTGGQGKWLRSRENDITLIKTTYKNHIR